MNNSDLTYCAEYFVKNQEQLFDEPVAENIEEAMEFLEDSMAEILDDINQVREYLEEIGMDVSDMSKEELEDQMEVFLLPDGRYLVVEA